MLMFPRKSAAARWKRIASTCPPTVTRCRKPSPLQVRTAGP